MISSFGRGFDSLQLHKSLMKEKEESCNSLNCRIFFCTLGMSIV